MHDPRTQPYPTTPRQIERENQMYMFARRREAMQNPINTPPVTAEGTLEFTGAPSLARGIRHLQRGEPGEALPEIAWGGFNALSLGTMPYMSGETAGLRSAPPRIPRIPRPLPEIAEEARLPNAPPRLPGRATDGSVLPIRPPEPIRQSMVGGSDDLAEAARMQPDAGGGQGVRDADAELQRRLSRVAFSPDAFAYRGQRIVQDGRNWEVYDSGGRRVRRTNSFMDAARAAGIDPANPPPITGPSANYSFEGPSGQPYAVRVEANGANGPAEVSFGRSEPGVRGFDEAPTGDMSPADARTVLDRVFEQVRADAQLHAREVYTVKGYTAQQGRIYQRYIENRNALPGYEVASVSDRGVITLRRTRTQPDGGSAQTDNAIGSTLPPLTPAETKLLRTMEWGIDEINTARADINRILENPYTIDRDVLEETMRTRRFALRGEVLGPEAAPRPAGLIGREAPTIEGEFARVSPDGGSAQTGRVTRRTIDAQHAPGYGTGTFEILQNPTVAQIDRFVAREMRDPANSWMRDARRTGGDPKQYYPLRYLLDADGNVYISSGLNVEHSHMAQGLRARGVDLGNDPIRSEFGGGQLQYRDGQWQFERGSVSTGGDFATSRDIFEPLDPNYPNVRPTRAQPNAARAPDGGSAQTRSTSDYFAEQRNPTRAQNDAVRRRLDQGSFEEVEVPIGRLNAVQSEVVGQPGAAAQSQLPLVVGINGENWLFDGTTRLARAADGGARSARVRFVSLDGTRPLPNAGPPRPPPRTLPRRPTQ